MSTSPTGMPGRSVRVMTLQEAFGPSVQPDALPMDALYQPSPSDAWVPPLDMARRLAREDLAKQQGANIHDREAMIGAAVTLEIRLRQLLAALDAEAVNA